MKYSRRTSSGFTLVELMVTCVLVAAVSILLASFTATWLTDNAITTARMSLLADAQSALDKTSSDIRLSGSADQNNRWADQNAPDDEYGWQSSSQVLVLASIATDTSRDVIYADPSQYISLKNNIVYFVDDHKLYKRTIAAPDDDNAATTTCPLSLSSSTCPSDVLVASDVQDFRVRYYDLDGNQVTPSSARSIELAITLSTRKFGQEISSSYNTRMVFRND